ncbi:hypothetical protein ABW21_db0205755 [Orbilia brochopaga]|nr:hypothetical protein ABW21_db0205755 [Drechslerella brochopaga]
MSAQQWERAGSTGSTGPDNGSPMNMEKQTLPSIQNLTHSVPAVHSPSPTGHSPSHSSIKTDTHDSGIWSMAGSSNSNHDVNQVPFPIAITTDSSLSSPMHMTLAAMTREHPTDAANRGSILNPDSQRDSQSLNPPYAHPPQSSAAIPSIFAPSRSNQSASSLHSATRPAPNVLTSPYGIDSSPSNSRRSSFDTRLSGLQLNSAQGTPAASQVSLVSQLQRERNGGYTQGSPAPSILENGNHTTFSPISPVSHFATNSISSNGSGQRGFSGSWSTNAPPTSQAAERPGARVAPPIIGSSRFPYPHPNAPSPTKGFPYAFPDPEATGPTAPNSRDGGFPGPQVQNGPGAPLAGRPYAYHADVNHNGAPPQHSQSSLYSQNSTSTTASSHHAHAPFGQPPFQEVHHHSLQRGASGLGNVPNNTPYSRTPELRVSHKLAERKRRKEMKELFDELRDALPAERGGKSSKWEVLTKSIEYLSQMRQQHNNLAQTNHDLSAENQSLSTTNEGLARELDRLRNELSAHNRAGIQTNGNHGNHSNHGNNYRSSATNGVNGVNGYGESMPHYNGGSHGSYQQSQNGPSHSMQSRPTNGDGNQMQGIERSSNY